jgi:hypothetical protein
MASFFNAERIQAGWRFFILWTITNLLGLGIGAAIEFFLFKQLNGNIAVLFSALAQAWTLNRHVSVYIPWATVTVVGWWLASIIGLIIFSMMTAPNDVIPLAVVAVIAGLLSGGLQFYLLKEWLPVGIWWLAVAAVGWLTLTILPAIVLTLILSKDAVSLEGRRFQISEVGEEAKLERV